MSGNASIAPQQAQAPTAVQPAESRKSVRFWLVLVVLLVCAFLAILESYAVSTTLPVIVADLHSSQFLWVSNAYGIASAVLLPLRGGFAEIMGRRPVILISILLFILGSALGGAAQNMNMLIAARTIQGAGAGGIFSLSQIILSDLISLKERGNYNGLFGLVWALSGGIGPVVGGGLARPTTWRWLFYLNIPIAGLAFLLICLLLSVPTPPGSLKQKLAKIDWIGNTIIIGAVCALCIALTWGGVVFPWTSARVLVPLCVGAVGVLVFLVYEWSWCKHPVVPMQLMSNRTGFSGYIQIFFSAFVNVNLIYYLPVYYQACKQASPTASGVDVFGISFSTAPFSILCGISIGHTGRYRPQIYVGWCLMLIGTGLLSSVDEHTSRAASIGYQVVAGAGIGILYAAAYFPVLAPLPIESNAYALSLFVFLRALAQICGLTAGGTILQNELQSPTIVAVGETAADNMGITYSLIPLITSLPQSTQDEVRGAFAGALATIWRMLIVIAGLGLLVSLMMKGLPLHGKKDENWALKEESAGKEKDKETVQS